MKQKRVLLLLSLLMVASLVFSAYGLTAAQEEEVVLRWRTRPDNQEEADVYQSISDSLELEGITLEYEPGGSETASYQDVLKTELASGTAPDVLDRKSVV